MRRVAAVVCGVLLSGGGTVARATAKPEAQVPARTMSDVIDRVITNENRAIQQIRQYSPLVETYIQNQRPDKELGSVPAGDKYFLGRADFSKGVALVSLTDTNSKGKKIFAAIGNFFSFSAEFIPGGFLQMIFIDTNGFDKQHYKFDYVRREFLGEVRCLVFDVTPMEKSGKGRFLGRIWVEDQDYNVVRFNGGYSGNGHASWYFHFDSWRTNVQPGVWLPSFVYSQESDLHYAVSKRLDFRAQTRLWGYNLGHASEEQELSKILVETPVQDDTKTANDLTPIQAQRSWDRQAEDNVIDRFERIGLIAPRGEVDKVLDTVVNNLEVTNNIEVEPEVRCRILTVSTLESFTIGHTLVLSRGLIDVLPDEASLATILAHELGHVVLGHRMDPAYGFFDNLLVDDKETFRHFGFARTPEEERAASEKAMQFLNNSPYKNQLGNAGLFLTALEERQKEIPNLISGHLGNRVPVIADLKTVATADQKQNPQTIVALPLGGRVKLDPWADKLELIKSKPIGTIAEREKMPFEVTPFMPYLTRFSTEPAKPIAASTAAQPDAKPSEAQPGKP
ncbi:MAG: M48 family metalloprotease [Acidobacteria bacterium Pan2503]|uniref:M48 family metalloprotease n=1 Tax=Candidatus Acidiferrum panamense TaxID=2741543 RepID=A0A7V8NNU9_9BACT|nr:M48 family metalloprotease [Candidatus Acidoferrum panamensis]